MTTQRYDTIPFVDPSCCNALKCLSIHICNHKSLRIPADRCYSAQETEATETGNGCGTIIQSPREVVTVVEDKWWILNAFHSDYLENLYRQ